MRHLFLIGLVWLCCMLAPPARAQGGTATQAVAVVGCPATIPPDEGAANARIPGTPNVRMEIAPTTRWAPVGGEVHFSILGVAAQPTHLSVSFVWLDQLGENQSACLPGRWIHLLAAPDTTTVTEPAHDYTYAARIPAFTKRNSFPWIPGLLHYALSSPVPQAEMYVRGTIPATTTTPAMDFVAPAQVGITTPWVALALSLLALVICWYLLRKLSFLRNIPGGPLLSFISSPGGVASASQFQVLIWTTVIGVGISYVMLLSGNLIDIPATTLGLLGVSGGALVGAKIAGQQGSAKAATVPGGVSGLAVLGTPGTAAALNWTSAADPAGGTSFVVQLRLAGAGTWDTVASDVAGPPYMVEGLNPGTRYEARVFAASTAGQGPPAAVSFTTAAAVAVAGAPGMIQGVTAVKDDERAVRVNWQAPNPAVQSVVVQVRAAGTLPWRTHSTDMSAPVKVGQLNPGTCYEFQVYSVHAGLTGTPSAVATATTATRTPLWSDLIMSDTDPLEVDVGRLQMLVFTSIAALFTVLTLLQTGQIPDIPDGVLELVTLSNGIYLAHKFTRRT